MLDTPRAAAHISFKLLNACGTMIRQRSLLLIPHKLHRIELGGISGKPFHLESFIATAQGNNRFPSMNTGLIP